LLDVPRAKLGVNLAGAAAGVGGLVILGCRTLQTVKLRAVPRASSEQ